MSKFVTYPAVTVLDNDHSLLIDSPNAGTNSITANNAADTLLSKWSGFDTFNEAVQNTISNNQEFIDRDTAIRSETADLKRKIVTTFPAKDASGQIATFESEFEDAPLKSCIVQVNPVQEGSGDPSPENERPITGWTGANIYKAGQNLIPNDIPAQFYHVYPIASKGAFVGSSNAFSTFIIPVPKGKICLARTTLSLMSYGALCDELPTVGANAFNVVTMSNRGSYTFDNSEGHKYLAITTMRNVEIDSDWESFLSTEPRLTIGDDVQPYTAPTNISTYPITFPSEAGTVFGAYVDVINGELVVDRAMVDLGTLTWNYYTGTTNLPVFYTWLKGTAISGINSAVCSALTCTNWQPLGSRTDKTICPHPSINNIYVADADRTDHDVSAFTASVTGVQYCYKLAEPIHYPLTPTEITSLLGTNNIWADTGDVSVEYLMSDVGWYVEKKLRAFQSILAGVEDSAVASKNYSTDSYLIFNDDIYRVTKTITAGETIEEGVNVTKTTVAEQLMALAQA